MRRAALAIVAVAGSVAGLAGVAGVAAPAAASPSAVTITIGTSSGVQKVTGRTLVVYRGSTATSTATVSGTVSGAPQGATATLLAQPFPFHGSYAKAGSVTLRGGASAPYKFKVRPQLATNYKVQVTGTGVTTATSGVRDVFVESQGAVTGSRTCARPVCHITLRVWVSLPPSTYRTEAAKHWYLYSGLRLAPHGTPAPPRFLSLDRSATASRPHQHHPWQFQVTLRFTFRIGRTDAFTWRVNFCTRDSVSADGLGLPGHHHCGDQKIATKRSYLG
jgi:hypothetical protein